MFYTRVHLNRHANSSDKLSSESCISNSDSDAFVFMYVVNLTLLCEPYCYQLNNISFIVWLLWF